MDFESLFETPEGDNRPTAHHTGGPHRDAVFGLHMHRPDSSALLVDVSGPLDLSTLERFDTEIRGLITDSSARRITVDLSRVTFLCVGGIATLLDVEHQARTLGKQLVLVSGTHPVDRPLQALGLMRRFTFGDPPWPVSTTGERLGDDGVRDIAAVAADAELVST